MKIHRVKAFTLMEMGIAMLISAIVIGITYTAYTLIIKSYSGYRAKNDRLSEMVRLDELLKKDFNRSDGIFLADSGIVLKNDNQRVVYDFKPGVIIRSGGIVDSFKFEYMPIVPRFESQTVATGMPETQSLVDDVEFSITVDKENFPYHYHKNYSSVNLIVNKP